ncbi:hypothetical protein BaRGS_00031249 [Batillaria attramentaria]|uniref:FUZ/MON1/HPS1 third Longin domain-containing protein n=1 Tax=Batillaria attramentaria TaxID=370345 RepID=A0ABD0JR02_9CAEN
MRSFVVVSQGLNNPIFLDFDADFARYINKKAVESGLQEASNETPEEVDAMLVMQLFSPLVLSQIPLANEVKNPCTSIVCPSGLILVFRKVDDIQYFAINGDGTESAEFLERKILVFIRMTKFLFGPAYTEIGNCPAVEREERWTFLRSILYTWTNMAKTDQTFLVEALERLHVNQLVSEKCVALLEKTVRKVQATSDSPTQHAFLLVNTKLLALRSSFELQPADILLTILLAKDLFPSKDGLEDLLASTPSYLARPRKHEPKPSKGEAKETEREERSEGEGEEEYHSAPTTPSGTRSQTPGNDTDAAALIATITTAAVYGSAGTPSSSRSVADSAHRDSGDGRGGSSSQGAVETDTGYPPLSPQVPPIGSLPGNYGLLQGVFPSDTSQKSSSSTTDRKKISASGRGSATPSDHSSLAGGDATSTAGTRSRSSTGHSQQSTSTQDAASHGYWPHTVFLQTPSCQYSPHALHCAQILPGITLIVVSQMSGYLTADPLCQVLSIVQDLLQARRSKLTRTQGLHVHEVITALLMKVQHGARKFKGRAHILSSDLLSRWENADLKERLVSYLQQDEHLPMLPELESPLMEFNRRQRELFQLLFLVPKSGTGDGGMEAGREVVSKMKVRLQQELMDYRDYLSVKAQRNITMTSYLDDFPGLIHFIYVDRQYHQMTAPSLNVISEQGKTDGTLFLKEKIWEMYGYMMQKLREGYTSVLTRNGDFYFSYFLWFEDSMGNPLPVQEPYKPTLETCPGTLTGHFYRRLRRQCFPQRVDGTVHCYEMFMMHVGLVTAQYVAAHCQRLARKLWEMSGEAFTPVNLL